jgi:hypothetical protein
MQPFVLMSGFADGKITEEIFSRITSSVVY